MEHIEEYIKQWNDRWHGDYGNLEELAGQEAKDYQELEALRKMYPREARFIAALVEDCCDALEYAGSVMFAQVMDPMSIYQLSEEIYYKLKGREGGRPHPDSPVMQMIIVLLCNEFHMRRGRYQRRMRRFW